MCFECVKDNLDINIYSDAKFDENMYIYIKEFKYFEIAVN